MIDKWGRKITYLRISVTDRCNLRCTYCMPEKGMDFINNDELLTNEEILRISKIMAEIGITKIRLTGGEPLVRNGIVDLVRKISQISGIHEVCMTTNGILLEGMIDDLKKAGLSRINISLDTMKRGLYKEITRGGDLNKVLKGIDLAIEHGLKVKLNTVIMRGINDDEIDDFVKLTMKKPVDIRFIEIMPIGEGKGHEAYKTEDLKSEINKNFNIEPCDISKSLDGPATYYRVVNSKGRIGFISAMSSCFCESCNRIRMTSEGFLKQCLHWNYGTDLKVLIRKGIADDELKEIIIKSIYEKPSKHSFGEKSEFGDSRLMYQIGG